MLRKIDQLFQSLNQSNIQYCHWKSIDHLDATLQGNTDLDMLFDRNKSAFLESLLLKLDFVRGHGSLILPWNNGLDRFG